MKFSAIKKMAVQYNINVVNKNKNELVRGIQEAEGNQPCFETNTVEVCGQHDCLWREDCH